MSGLEVIGIVASIIQLADLGTKLSVKLCTFYRTVKIANQSLQGLSSDVSLTCSILNEFGKVLEQDDQTKICSQQAFRTAQQVLVECKAVFEQIETALEKYDREKDIETNPLRRGARRISAVFAKPDLDVLKSHLERLKTTTLLMLHVIMYAGDLRNRQKTKTDLKNQHDLIQTLIEERRASQHKISYPNQSFISVALENKSDSTNFFTRHIKAQNQPADLPNEVREYYNLIQKLLQEVDAYKDILEDSRHSRIRTSIANSHSTEVYLLSKIHGRTVQQLFDDPFFSLYEARIHEGYEPVICHNCDGYGIRFGVHTYVPRPRRAEKGISRGRSRSRSRHRSHPRDSLGRYILHVRSRSRSRTHDRSRSRPHSRLRSHSPFYGRDTSTTRSKDEDAPNERNHRQCIARAGLAGAAIHNLVELKGQRSHSRLRRHTSTMPVISHGAGTAAATGFYEKKAEKENGDSDTDTATSNRRHGSGSSTSSRSRSRPGGRFVYDSDSQIYPDPSSSYSSAALIEYGTDPSGSIPHEKYYGDPASFEPEELENGPYYLYDGDSLIDDADTARIARDRRASRRRSSTTEYSSATDSADFKPNMDTVNNMLSKTSLMDEALENTTVLKNLVLEWTTLTREEISEE